MTRTDGLSKALRHVLWPVLAATSIAFAAEGDLDPGFGYYHDGTAYLPIEDRLPGQFANDRAVAILPQPDGSTILVGNINRTTRHGPPTAFDSIGIAKLRPEGTYDYSFGSGGGWFIIAGSGVAGNEILAWSADQDINGRIVIAGYRSIGGKRNMAVWRLTPAGALDAAFANGGVLTIDRGFAASVDEARSIRAPRLKDVVAETFTSGYTIAGTLRDSATATSATALFPITDSGALALSPAFGTTSITSGPNAGARYTVMPIPAAYVACDSSAAAHGYRSLSSGNFIWYVAGNLICPDGSRRLQTTRLGVNALPVASFGGAGTAVTAFDGSAPPRSRATALTIDGLGRVIVAGSTLQTDLSTPANMAVTMLNVAGAPDGNFNGTGSRVLAWPASTSSWATGVLAQRNNRLLVSGSVSNGSPVMAVARLLPTAASDPGWSIGIGRTYPFIIQAVPSQASATTSSFAVGESIMLGGWVNDVRPAFNDIDFGAMRMIGDLIYANGFGIDDW